MNKRKPRKANRSRARRSDGGDQDTGREAAPSVRPELLINRELSWLEFNQRVIEESADTSVPLLERLKFIGIAAANLDEFFMVRVAGLLGQEHDQVQTPSADGMRPSEQLEAIAERVRRMFSELGDVVRDDVLPALSAKGAELAQTTQLDEQAQKELTKYFRTQVLPVLTPLAIDPGHPFPHLKNLSLNIITLLSGTRVVHTEFAFGVVQVPGVLPRLVRVPDEQAHTSGRVRFVLLDDLIATHIGALFPGFRSEGAWPFRVIRNFDLSIDEEEAEDLLEVVKQEVRRRDRGKVVAIVVDAHASESAQAMLRESLDVEHDYVFSVNAPLNLPDLLALGAPLQERAELKDAPFEPQVLPPLRSTRDLFTEMRRQDILLHHPYESFDPVVSFVETAAVDPEVLAIKQTLYRTSGDSPIVKALMRAAENGKQVTALVEIKARFDEENNIQWARKLEEAGVHVVYGLVGLKTHAKAALIVRRERGRLVRYVHLGTGNYNPHTAELYTDLSLFTARPDVCADTSSLFNLLTSCTAPATWKKLIVAPLGLHERTLGLIEREAAHARAGKPARIVAKMNALVDPDVIQALYRASQAGVDIELIVRGICCLRPGVKGTSERIVVRSIVDRFLEHARIFCFHNAGAWDVFGSSADWMQRNFHRRVEVMFPIEDEALKQRIMSDILGSEMQDNVKAYRLQADGTYVRWRPSASGPTFRSQAHFLARASETATRADTAERREKPFVVRPIRQRPTKDLVGGSADEEARNHAIRRVVRFRVAPEHRRLHGRCDACGSPFRPVSSWLWRPWWFRLAWWQPPVSFSIIGAPRSCNFSIKAICR